MGAQHWLPCAEVHRLVAALPRGGEDPIRRVRAVRHDAKGRHSEGGGSAHVCFLQFFVILVIAGWCVALAYLAIIRLGMLPGPQRLPTVGFRVLYRI